MKRNRRTKNLQPSSVSSEEDNQILKKRGRQIDLVNSNEKRFTNLKTESDSLGNLA